MRCVSSAASVAVVAVAFASIPASAQAPMNRRIESIAIVPAASGHDVHVVWTVEATESSVPIDASTVVAIFVGPGAEVPTASAGKQIVLDPLAAFCGIGSCSGGCGGGSIDGVFNTMLCLPDGACPGGGCDCDCRFPYFTSSFPSLPLEVGVEVLALLLPASGANPEIDDFDDGLAILMPGSALFWDRAIESVEVTPVAELPGAHDIVVQGHTAWRLPGGDADLGFELRLFVDGELAATTLVPGFAGPPAPGTVGCGGGPGICTDECGTWNFDPAQCEAWFGFPGYELACECAGGWSIEFLAVPSEPGGKIELFAAPLPESLPPLPGSEEDDSAEVPIPGGCAGDLDGDGIVGGADLGLLLAAWGTRGPGDLDRSGTVDGADLGLLLSAWGACRPM